MELAQKIVQVLLEGDDEARDLAKQVMSFQKGVTPQHHEMAYGEWQDKFRPVKNTVIENEEDRDDAPFDGCMFETFGPEFEHVRRVAAVRPDTVWTYVTGNGDAIVEGFHWVNRMGYFITEVPFNPRHTYDIKLEGPEEEVYLDEP